jgi:hypothetical protein
MPQSPDSQVMLFADDTNVLLFAKDETQLMGMSEECLNQLFSWFCCNKLTLNFMKTNYCIFHKRYKKLPSHCDKIKFGNECIHRVSNVKYLGMTIDERLEWKIHSENLIRKLVRISGTFKFLRNYVPYKCKKQLYYAYVYTTISYGIQVYGNTRKHFIKKIYKCFKIEF